MLLKAHFGEHTSSHVVWDVEVASLWQHVCGRRGGGERGASERVDICVSTCISHQRVEQVKRVSTLTLDTDDDDCECIALTVVRDAQVMNAPAREYKDMISCQR